MLPTPAQGEARPHNGRLRRVRRAGIVAGVTAALVGGGLTAVSAAPASAATHTVKASEHFSVSDRSYVKGAKPVVTVVSWAHGRHTSGKVYFRVSGKLVKVSTLSHGKATYRLSSKLSTGHHRVRATVHPSSSSVSATTRYTTVGVHKYSSRVVYKATKYTGVRYVYGGTTPRGFDCSGFTRYVYKKETGKTLPRTSSGQRHVGKVVAKTHAKAGDLVYTPGHVAIYVGGNKIIDAPRPGERIHVRSMWSASWTFIHVTSKANTI